MSREIDAMVAEHVFEKKPIWGVDLGTLPLFDYSVEYNSKGHTRNAEPYSTSIEAAWEVVMEMRERGFEIQLFTVESTGAWGCSAHEFVGEDEVWAVLRSSQYDESAAVAICLTALQLVGVEVGDE